MAIQAVTINEEHVISISETPAYLQSLRAFVPSVSHLKDSGYITDKLLLKELQEKIRCCRCGVRVSKNKTDSMSTAGNSNHGEASNEEQNTNHAKVRCKFHTGRVSNKAWTCCSQHVTTKSCQGKTSHEFEVYTQQQLQNRWQVHFTPLGNEQGQHCSAVAIDCEMGIAYDGESQLVRLTVLDYFSGATLIDKLVYPDVKMKHYNTRFSGVSTAQMETAKKRGQCIRGVANARRELWKFVGPDTIVVGHSANHDLGALRWVHLVIVDSFLIESKQPVHDIDSSGAGGKSLKALAMRRLGREIQKKSQKGHDSQEDAMAARDLVHWRVMRPDLEEH